MAMLRRSLKLLDTIIIRHTGTPEDFNVAQVREAQKAPGKSDVDFHFLVGQDGIKEGRDIHFATEGLTSEIPNRILHAQGRPKIDLNISAISLAVIGDYHAKDPEPELIYTLAFGVITLCDKFGIKLDRAHVYGQKNIEKTASPGRNTMMLLYRRLGLEGLNADSKTA